MRMTLLEIVQSILAEMEGDQVNDISDTDESYDLALMVRDLYYDLAVELDTPEHNGVVQLTASGSALRPTTMTIPSNVYNIHTIRYDARLSTDTEPVYKQITYLPFSDFLAMVQTFKDEDNAETYTATVDGNSFTLWYRDDVAPTYFTTLDDTTLFFDSLDSTVDTTLQTSKTICEASYYPTFTLSNNFYPDLNPVQFPYFLNTCKVRAFEVRKQLPHRTASQAARRLKIINQERNHKAPGLTSFDRLPKYGRRS